MSDESYLDVEIYSTVKVSNVTDFGNNDKDHSLDLRKFKRSNHHNNEEHFEVDLGKIDEVCQAKSLLSLQLQQSATGAIMFCTTQKDSFLRELGNLFIVGSGS